MTEHRAGKYTQNAVPDCTGDHVRCRRVRSPRRAFRAQCQAIAVAILKGVHLFFNYVEATSPIARLNNGVCSTIGKRISL